MRSSEINYKDIWRKGVLSGDWYYARASFHEASSKIRIKFWVITHTYAKMGSGSVQILCHILIWWIFILNFSMTPVLADSRKCLGFIWEKSRCSSISIPYPVSSFLVKSTPTTAAAKQSLFTWRSRFGILSGPPVMSVMTDLSTNVASFWVRLLSKRLIWFERASSDHCGNVFCRFIGRLQTSSRYFSLDRCNHFFQR